MQISTVLVRTELYKSIKMASSTIKIKNCILSNNDREIIELLNSGLDPNLEGGWPIRLAARYGCHLIVKVLIQFGANPHLLSEAGASTLQLAVYSGESWSGDKWNFLLSYCDSSQLADGAAVAIIFQNVSALEKIISTGRCNTNIPTTLTGKTVEQLAKGYKMHPLLTVTSVQNPSNITPTHSPRSSRHSQAEARSASTLRPHHAHRNLSPSVARFFHQTASQTSLTSPRNAMMVLSPTSERIPT